MKKRFSEEQIVRILKEADSAGTAREVVRKHNISEQTFYRWKQKKKRRVGRSTLALKQATYPHQLWSYDFVHDRTAELPYN